MRSVIRTLVVGASLVSLVLPLGAQTRQGLMGDLLKDIGEVEQKIVGLAKAMPQAAY